MSTRRTSAQLHGEINELKQRYRAARLVADKVIAERNRLAQQLAIVTAERDAFKLAIEALGRSGGTVNNNAKAT